MFLYLCMCRYGYVKNERKRSKTDKNEHEIGKKSKAVAGEAKRSKISHNAHRSPQRFREYQYQSLDKVQGDWQFQSLQFQNLAIMVLKAKFEEKAYVVLHYLEYVNLYPREKVSVIYRFGPYGIQNYKFGPCDFTTPKLIKNTTGSTNLFDPPQSPQQT